MPSVLSLLARFAVLSLYLSQCPTVSALLCCRVPYSLSRCVLLVITIESFEAIGSDTGSGDFTPLDSATSWTFPLGEQEAQLYYAGLPSRPILIARSSITPWTPPPSLEAYAELKELRPVGQHPISAIWERDLAPEVHAYLADQMVQWTSADIVRIGQASKRSLPVVLWIGVQPRSLSGEDGHAVVVELQRRLRKRNLDDVEVEIRESVVTRLAGCPLLGPRTPSDVTVDFVEPLSASLGLPIAAKRTPHAEGAGGLFMAKKGDNKNKNTLYLLTARHVVIPSHEDDDKKYEYKKSSQPRREVVLLGDAAYRKLLSSINTEIEGKETVARFQLKYLARAAGKGGPKDDKKRADAQDVLDKANSAIKELRALCKEVDSQ